MKDTTSTKDKLTALALWLLLLPFLVVTFLSLPFLFALQFIFEKLLEVLNYNIGE